ncbi:putative ankyrin repeat protein RF_0381 [Oscarella lobularis]|uniref:putative ankyrin repeat protein RF_0381 n=1 Tax=Oscarella lobularis TaxID=121494 RepID=UPI00331370B8
MDSAVFLTAIETGRTAKIRDFLSKEPTKWKTVVTENGTYAIGLAILCRSLEIASYFLSMGWDIEGRVDKSGATAFLCAAYCGFVEGVDLFVKRGCNVEAKDDEGDGALACACLGGHLAMVKKLTVMGFSVNETHQKDYTALHCASDQGHVAIAAYLIENGADIEAQTKLGSTPFLLACKNRRIGVVDLLISKGCNIFAKSKQGYGALAMACWKGNVAIAEKLIRFGLDVNKSEASGYTALHWACDEGNIELADFLITNGAHLEAENELGCTPFLLACNSQHNSQHVGVVELLIFHGCNIFAKRKARRGDGALALASWNGNVELVSKLIQLGLDVNESQVFGRTSLHWAAQFGHLEVAEILISNGANIEAKDERGNTPVLCSAMSSNVDLFITFMVSTGCDIQAKNKEILGRGVLGTASAYGQVKMVKKLIGMAFYLFETDYFGQTALHWAAKYGEKKVARLLIKSGSNIEDQDKWGRTPFLYAVSHGQKEFADFLLSKGCDSRAVSHEGHSALALACIENHQDTAEWLLSKFNDLDLNSALHLAVQRDAESIVELLISRKADCESRDEWGCTPLLSAIEFGSDNVIELLLKKGCDVYARTKKGEGALDMAIMGGRLDLFRRFMMLHLAQETRTFLQKATNESEEANEFLNEVVGVLQCRERSFISSSPSPQECH